MASPEISDPRPLYAQVTDALLADIRLNHQPGDLLPTQQQLAHRYNASLITIKRALAEIGRLGLIESVRGKGTIVRRPAVVDAHTGVSSWTDNMRGMGGTPSTAWCRIDLKRPTQRIGRLLGMKPGELVLVIRRLRTLDRSPACLMINHLPADLVPGLESAGLDDESLYAVLQNRFGITPHYADEEVAARQPKTAEFSAFGETCGTILQVSRTTFTNTDRPIEFAVLSAPSTQYTYRVRVTSNKTPRS